MNRRWLAIGLCSLMVVGCATDPHTGEKRPLGKVVGVDRSGRAIRLALEDAGVEVQRTTENTLDLDVPFAFGSASLTPQVQSTLKSVASVLNQYPESTVTVTGHADDIGSDKGNQRLSEQRAGAVAGYLTSNGVNAARISQEGMGERMPKTASTDEAVRAQNRRVELTIVTHRDVGKETSARPPSESPAAPRTYPPSGSE
ncbi:MULTISPECIES: OmpA family protein [Methylocaldum]|uniref:OmpA family protein n=1 Tax=Methylocaldum sp. 14B TaxID=1912213 RepID=UPI00098A965B|nr:OmpA family protein [Methylocaldum sp. 14B]